MGTHGKVTTFTLLIVPVVTNDIVALTPCFSFPLNFVYNFLTDGFGLSGRPCQQSVYTMSRNKFLWSSVCWFLPESVPFELARVGSLTRLNLETWRWRLGLHEAQVDTATLS